MWEQTTCFVALEMLSSTESWRQVGPRHKTSCKPTKLLQAAEMRSSAPAKRPPLTLPPLSFAGLGPHIPHVLKSS